LIQQMLFSLAAGENVKSCTMAAAWQLVWMPRRETAMIL
jgi:hypothetical protein